MNNQLFSELLESAREAVQISWGKQEPSRAFKYVKTFKDDKYGGANAMIPLRDLAIRAIKAQPFY